MLLVILTENKAYLGDVRQLWLEMAEGRRRVATTLLNLIEVAKLLARDKWSMGKIVEFLRNTVNLKGLTLLGVEAFKLEDALKICAKYDVDPVDAYTVLAMRAQHIKVIFSLYRDFDKFGKEFVRRTEILAE